MLKNIIKLDPDLDLAFYYATVKACTIFIQAFCLWNIGDFGFMTIIVNIQNGIF